MSTHGRSNCFYMETFCASRYSNLIYKYNLSLCPVLFYMFHDNWWVVLFISALTTGYSVYLKWCESQDVCYWSSEDAYSFWIPDLLYDVSRGPCLPHYDFMLFMEIVRLITVLYFYLFIMNMNNNLPIWLVTHEEHW